ncbi:hypothetical protein RhiirC2_781811 [Rhizophagus irregularis]|uniref:Uncharacterized protein n=1 Tax=Rhizophagus irregularis TaxID=588596 RepID=A0A2N1N4H4_9GLOM|nr:hypothetical protein RhiirC2_781811 [Rhizophagus irregularis]
MLYTWDITGGRINHYLSPIIPTDLRFEYPGTLSKALLGDSESMAQISMCAWIQILQTLEMILNEFRNNIGDSKMLFGVSGARDRFFGELYSRMNEINLVSIDGRQLEADRLVALHFASRIILWDRTVVTRGCYQRPWQTLCETHHAFTSTRYNDLVGIIRNDKANQAKGLIW